MRRLSRPVAHDPVPTVNLLSPWAFEAIATRRLRQRFVAAAVVLVLLLGAGWMVQRLRVGQAEEALTAGRAETARLAAQTKELAPVRTYVATVDQQTVTVQEAMKNEVRLSRVLAGLGRATPTGAKVGSVTVTVSPPSGGPGTTAAAAPVTPTAAGDGEPSTCPGPDPFNTRVVVGCVTLSGSARSRASVGALVVSLGRDPLFVEPFISTTTTAEGDEVTFTGSVGLSTKAFTRRYAKLDVLLTKGTR